MTPFGNASLAWSYVKGGKGKLAFQLRVPIGCTAEDPAPIAKPDPDADRTPTLTTGAHELIPAL